MKTLATHGREKYFLLVILSFPPSLLKTNFYHSYFASNCLSFFLFSSFQLLLLCIQLFHSAYFSDFFLREKCNKRICNSKNIKLSYKKIDSMLVKVNERKVAQLLHIRGRTRLTCLFVVLFQSFCLKSGEKKANFDWEMFNQIIEWLIQWKTFSWERKLWKIAKNSY